MLLNSSAARWFDVPWPLEANEYFSGSFLSSATNSRRLLAGTDLFTDMTLGMVATTVSGVKSLSASYGSLVYTQGALPCVLTEPIRMV